MTKPTQVFALTGALTAPDLGDERIILGSSTDQLLRLCIGPMYVGTPQERFRIRRRWAAEIATHVQAKFLDMAVSRGTFAFESTSNEVLGMLLAHRSVAPGDADFSGCGVRLVFVQGLAPAGGFELPARSVILDPKNATTLLVGLQELRLAKLERIDSPALTTGPGN